MPARYELNQLVRANDNQQRKTLTYEYINGNIKYVHEYDYTTGTLPETPLKTTEYHYDDEVWSDVLTGVSQYSYSTSNVSTYGLRNNSSSSIEEYARSILGDDLGDYEIVDFGSKALLNPQSESSGASTYSLPRSTNLNYTYSVESDEIGNITNIDGIEIEWNGRRAERVQKGNNTITYEYNIDGQRVSKTVNGVKTEYFYNGSILAGQKTGNDTVIFMYDNNGDIFGFNYNGEDYYYIKNAQNDVVLILNGDRTAAVIYMYDAWGNITGALDLSVDKISNINPILYRSYYYDIEMGVYYLNSRYYAPVICRFMSGDALLSTEQGMIGNNMFAYCGNNPVLRSDTSGNLWETVFDVVSLCISIVDVASNPRDPWAWAGLVADAVDLIPFVTGVGEVVRSVNVTRKALDTVDTLNDVRKVTKAVSNTYETAKTGKKLANVASDAKKAAKKVNIGCFVAGTQVLSAQGLVSIETISAGDLVWAENPETGEKGLKRVVQTIRGRFSD